MCLQHSLSKELLMLSPYARNYLGSSPPSTRRPVELCLGPHFPTRMSYLIVGSDPCRAMILTSLVGHAAGS